MHETQKRREQLLKQSRNRNRVHPRYQAGAFVRKEEKEESSSLGIRIFFSMLLFLIFAVSERYEENLFYWLKECIMGR